MDTSSLLAGGAFAVLSRLGRSRRLRYDPAGIPGQKEVTNNMSKVFHPQRLESYAPRERRNLLLAGLVMTTLSAVVAWAGASGSGARGVVVLAVGIIGVLFFGPITVYVVSQLLRIRRTAVPNRHR